MPQGGKVQFVPRITKWEQELNFNSKRPNQKDAKGGEVIFCDWLWGAWKDKKEKESIETAGTINMIILQKQKKSSISSDN